MAKTPTSTSDSTTAPPPSAIEIVDWDGPSDPTNPFNWPLGKKWLVTFLALLASFSTMLNGTMITVAHEAINARFGVSDARFPHSYWPVTAWAAGGALFSLLVLPIMEDFGVRRVFLGTYGVFLAFIVPQAVAQNFATLVVSRFFSGGCVSILANTSAGVIGNVWEDERGRTLPMTLYITVYLVGSSMGPVIGAAVFASLSWRWISYVQLIVYGALFIVYAALFPESRGSAILGRRAQSLRNSGRNAFTAAEADAVPLPRLMLDSAKRPLQMLVTEPVVLAAALMAALIIGLIYLFTQSVEQVFVGLFHMTAIEAGYVQSAVIIGELVGGLGALVSARLYFASAKRNTEIPGVPIPEARLYLAVVAAFAGMAGGMFVYAWTSVSSLPWVAPAVGLAMVGAGNVVVIIGVADYLVDAYAKYAGSAIAAVTLGENLSAAFLPLAAQSMYTNLGYRWASSLLGFIALALSFSPVVLVVWGRKIRAKSPFMKEATNDKKKESEVSKVG
ncbi:uncharacterized protein K452DRAFT_314286 [Aplosporella prunicola CBS 121167]|uniref:Major facilitator superfamily (MFS) profile domain-containing protein n=1 Tax=Aplosporella prunicola CBS 121167 TaxID=1176127 RepID=A0A6A6BUZ9_9PEZI|nr:uncharacterized protein K452DRAFT_314286 [Aplosporella prunicola CBS 121167]KAF2147044.1 hypothetical protein K452DRAFT_314286 [Aplosporella prunicola CBS 121167]